MNVSASKHTLDVPCTPDRHGTTTPLDDDTMRAIIDAFWPVNQEQTETLDNFRAYVAFLRWECDHSLHSAHAATTFSDLLGILDVVKANTAVPMKDLRQKVRESNPKIDANANDLRISASIELAVRLCFMINVRNVMPADSFTLRTALPWPDDASLQDVIENWHRQNRQQQASFIQHMIKPNFPSIPDLERVAGFKILWTNDLMNHLEVNNRTLYIFQHVSVLRRIQQSNSRYE